MVARPGRMQASFTAGELDPAVRAQTSFKYYARGLATAVNVVPVPQGGFDVADGMRHVGRVSDTATRGADFSTSTGAVYDLIFDESGKVEMWGASSKAFELATPYSAGQVDALTYAQQLDVMVMFHPDVQPKRLKYKAAGDWTLDAAPFTKIPRYDYGGVYTNGVDAVWELQFTGVDVDNAFVITVSSQDTPAIRWQDIVDDGGTLSEASKAALLQEQLRLLANVKPTLTVTPGSKPKRYLVTFVDDPGDDFAVSGRVTTNADAAITAYKTVAGVAPGEDIMSSTRGWPRCGCFYQQRLLVGGLRSLPNNWIASTEGDYFNLDERVKTANGPFVVPMDAAGGETIERMVAGRNLLIFTNQAEYWIAERSLSKTAAPNHVQASRHGCARGVSIVENEGAALFAYAERGEIGEFRYTDVDGNFQASSLSILASHLTRGVSDLAIRRAGRATSGNLLAVIRDGGLSLAILLREQEVTGFVQRITEGTVISVWANGRNQLCAIVERKVGGSPQRFLERFEPGLLLDGAVTGVVSGAEVSGLGVHQGATVWAIDDDDVFGPFTVAGSKITLPRAPTGVVTVGRWTPPIADTLPPPRDVGPNIVVQRPARMHSVQLSLRDTTSVALAVNGQRPRDVPLRRFGDEADVGELAQGFTGISCSRGFTGFADEPFVTVTQLRPGRLGVRAITGESSLG